MLILHSFHEGYQWTDDINEAVQTSLKEWDPGIQFFIEYMDAKRIYPDILEPDLHNLYKKKYGYQSFDLIILSDNIALEFLRQYRDEIFGQVPTFFCGINDFTEASTDGLTNITGITEDTDMKGTVEMILRVQPEVKYLAGISDFVSAQQGQVQDFLDLQSGFEGKLQFISLSSLSEKELLQAIDDLPEESALLYLSFLKDKERMGYSLKDSLNLITGSTELPVYTLWDWGVGQGAVGGIVSSGTQQGRETADLILKYLKGVPMEKIPVVTESPNIAMFDYQQLKKIPASVQDLPRGSVIINRPITFYQEYTLLIWLTIGLMSLLLLLIFSLVSYLLRRRKMEAKLQRAQKMEALGRMAGGLAHDFNNMLTAINGASELIERDGSLSDESREYLSMIFETTDRSKELINNLLAYSRKAPMSFKPLEMGALVENSVQLLNRTIDKSIGITYSGSPEGLPVSGDKSMLLSALLNLGLNAKDAMPDGGQLFYRAEKITLEKAMRDELHLKEGDYARVCVEDTGEGIPEKLLEKIFDPFFTTKKPGKGTGLGLAGVYGCIRSHNGTIRVASQIGEGTVFTLYIPLNGTQ
ncbi:MAG: hypothetical protein JXA95_12815 [Spirochaetales bacterium]|nr:hypothetical protein [Spirochaetales bacterium]